MARLSITWYWIKGHRENGIADELTSRGTPKT
jgi:hypothetical protein